MLAPLNCSFTYAFGPAEIIPRRSLTTSASPKHCAPFRQTNNSLTFWIEPFWNFLYEEAPRQIVPKNSPTRGVQLVQWFSPPARDWDRRVPEGRAASRLHGLGSGACPQGPCSNRRRGRCCRTISTRRWQARSVGLPPDHRRRHGFCPNEQRSWASLPSSFVGPLWTRLAFLAYLAKKVKGSPQKNYKRARIIWKLFVWRNSLPSVAGAQQRVEETFIFSNTSANINTVEALFKLIGLPQIGFPPRGERARLRKCYVGQVYHRAASRLPLRADVVRHTFLSYWMKFPRGNFGSIMTLFDNP